MTSPSQATLRGTWYLLPTAFDDAGDLDLASQRRIVDAAVSWGVDGLTVMGVMSEPGSLTDDERRRTLQAIFEAANGRVPIIVGCSSVTRHGTVARMKEARSLGAVAAMVAAPALLRNVDLVPDYMAAVHRDSGLPVLIQDEPAATGVLMPISILIRAAQAAGTSAIKVEEPPTPPKMARLLAVDPGLTLFGGLGGMFALHELKRGAAGTMTGFAYPEIMRAVRLALESGHADEAGRLFDRYLPLITFEAQQQVGLLIRKEVLRRRGALSSARTRHLVSLIDDVSAAELSEIFGRVGIQPSLEPLAL